ncbi:MAG: thiamine pyrophosphate-binding protein [Lentisphaerae bacterium]|nr:thiamine pyrophosphate-binding protein [Lentisphaerota bacterium]
MKLADYVAGFIAASGVNHVFVLAGGASLHLIDSIGKRDDLQHICPLHEQAAAMAAEAYSRATGNLGAAVATSGPGATNLITGICCAYYDSVPVLLITGQVSTFRSKGDTGVRQIGFQETEVVPMVQTITNYAVRIDSPDRIRYELEKACYLARSGRPGPVLVDIPDDLQRAEIDPETLTAFVPEGNGTARPLLTENAASIIRLIEQAERPILVLGWGVHLSQAERAAVTFAEQLQLPVAPTWAAADILPAIHPLSVGTFGTHGTRYGNFAVQNADLIISIGSRLDTKATGSPATTFARGAKKVVIDIDAAELNKFTAYGLDIDLLVQADAGDMLRELNAISGNTLVPKRREWMGRINEWQGAYPMCPPRYADEDELNPYYFVKQLSRACAAGATMVSDTGCALAWMMQAFEFKKKQRFFHDFNNTAMGWALPAAIGVCLALQKPIVCIVGDGSIQMNIQELATIVRYELPIKIFLINNHGYSMIRQTQDQWLGSQYLASSSAGGVADPNFSAIASAYGIESNTLERNGECADKMAEVMAAQGPFLCNVQINHSHRVIPQVKFGRPNEDSEPLLGREEFLRCMIVEPVAG